MQYSRVEVRCAVRRSAVQSKAEQGWQSGTVVEEVDQELIAEIVNNIPLIHSITRNTLLASLLLLPLLTSPALLLRRMPIQA
jgi:hypothetical protein